MSATYKLVLKNHTPTIEGSLTTDEVFEAAYNPAAWIICNKWPTLANLVNLDWIYPCADARDNDGHEFTIRYPEKSDIFSCVICIPEGSFETSGRKIMRYSEWFSNLGVVSDWFYRRKEQALRFCRQIAQALDAGYIDDVLKFASSLADEAVIEMGNGTLPPLQKKLKDGDIRFFLRDCVIIYDAASRSFYGYPCIYDGGVAFGDKFQVTFNN